MQVDNHALSTDNGSVALDGDPTPCSTLAPFPAVLLIPVGPSITGTVSQVCTNHSLTTAQSATADTPCAVPIHPFVVAEHGVVRIQLQRDWTIIRRTCFRLRFDCAAGSRYRFGPVTGTLIIPEQALICESHGEYEQSWLQFSDGGESLVLKPAAAFDTSVPENEDVMRLSWLPRLISESMRTQAVCRHGWRSLQELLGKTTAD